VVSPLACTSAGGFFVAAIPSPEQAPGLPVMKPEAIKRPPVVLYVEDDADHRDLMRLAAKESQVKFGLALAHGFQDALDYLSGQDKYANRMQYPLPTLVLLDYALRNFKGTDLARWIRKQTGLSGLPVVMFSNCMEVLEMAECYVAGADYFIRKPMHFEDLLKVVRGLDACLEHQPPRLAALADVAADPTVDRQALSTALRDGLAENRALQEQARARLAKLDLTMAVRKEVLKKIPFVPNTERKPQEQG
jgi:two-component system, response regulator